MTIGEFYDKHYTFIWCMVVIMTIIFIIAFFANENFGPASIYVNGSKVNCDYSRYDRCGYSLRDCNDNLKYDCVTNIIRED